MKNRPADSDIWQNPDQCQTTPKSHSDTSLYNNSPKLNTKSIAKKVSTTVVENRSQQAAMSFSSKPCLKLSQNSKLKSLSS